MTVKELLFRMSSKELSEWQAFYAIEPFGEARQDLRFALMTANLMVPHMKKGYEPKLEDFILKLEKKEPMTDDQMKNMLKGFC